MRRRKVGVIVSDKANKTVVVKVSYYIKHPLYKKYVRKALRSTSMTRKMSAKSVKKS